MREICGENSHLSRQRRWQLKKIAEGKCSICGKKAVINLERCVIHIIKNRVRNREYRHCQKKRDGGRGRPFKYFGEE